MPQTTISIQGVGNVQVDGNFTSLSEAEQQRTIEQIIAQHNSGRQRRASQPQPQDPLDREPNPDVLPMDQPEPVYDNGPTFANGVDDLDINGDGFYSDEELMAAANAQAPFGDPIATNPPPANPSPPAAPEDSVEGTIPWYQSLGIGIGQGVTFNYGDEALAGLATVNPFNPTSAWRSGKGLRGSFDDIVTNYRNIEEQAAEDDPVLYYGGQVLGSVAVPFGVGRQAVRAASVASQASRGARAGQYARAAGTAAAAGAVAGSGADTGNPLERLDGAGLGALMGGGVGVASHGLSRYITRDRRMQRWVQDQIRENPHAAMDAEIVADLAAARHSTPRSPTDPQGRSLLSAREINDVQDQYTDSLRRQINEMGDLIDPVEKDRLIRALEQRYSATEETIASLRGTPQGDAVADALMRVERLRALTPEIQSSARGPIKKAFEIASGVGGAYAGGPMGAGGAYGVARYLTSRLAGGEASRANAADMLLNRADFYQALSRQAGPSPTRNARPIFQGVYEDAMNAATAQRRLAEVNQRVTDQFSEAFPLSRAANTSRADRAILADDPLDRTMQLSNTVQRQLTRDAARTAGESQTALANFQRTLEREGVVEAPSRSSNRSPRQPSPVNEGIAANIAAGIPGNTRTQEVIANMAGVPREDMLRALDGIAERYPAMASDIQRIRLNYQTENRGAGGVLAPAIRQFLEEDGTMARLAQQAQEAQARLSARTQMMSGQAAARAADQPLPLDTPTPAASAPEPPPIPARDQPTPVQQDMPLGPSAGSVAGRMTPEEELSLAQYYRDDMARVRNERGDDIYGIVGDGADLDYLYSRGWGDFMRGTTDAPPQLRPIDRPEQWAQGRDRYLGQAQSAIDNLMADLEIPDEAYGIIGRAPDSIRDNYRTTEAAIDFIDTQVIPDLEIRRVSPATIQRIRSHLVNIANAKPYRDQAAYDAGTRPRN